ncbi:hypothetical protein QJS10_CPA01g01446 [Acorus calamus]|uniref:Mce/MlaD domain-containing protein n=1 Tax=Acorus calamus TaxID=4465 RepID=A0AAV9FLP0_ACOCL|nr:hypothetical protein QJS10_CPA01g01446 [Acorus calamus]
MVVNALINASACKTGLSPHSLSRFIENEYYARFVSRKPSRQPFCIHASSPNSGTEQNSPAPLKGKSPLTLVLDIPRTLWSRTLHPLSNFGFGSRSIWEGGVGLFIVSGAVLLALTLVWLRGFHLRSRFRKYQTVFEFSQACGICMGTPVRIRGVTVGSVVRVNPSLKSIDAVVEVDDEKIIIPRNALVEVNQSGLLMETLIDITPRDPLPTPSIEAMAEDVQPLLAELRDSSLLKDVENLTKGLVAATEDLRRVNSSLLTPEIAEQMRKSISTLVFTLKNLESISSDVSGFTGDEATRRNLKLLIKSLSRLL